MASAESRFRFAVPAEARSYSSDASSSDLTALALAARTHAPAAMRTFLEAIACAAGSTVVSALFAAAAPAL